MFFLGPSQILVKRPQSPAAQGCSWPNNPPTSPLYYSTGRPAFFLCDSLSAPSPPPSPPPLLASLNPASTLVPSDGRRLTGRRRGGLLTSSLAAGGWQARSAAAGRAAEAGRDGREPSRHHADAAGREGRAVGPSRAQLRKQRSRGTEEAHQHRPAPRLACSCSNSSYVVQLCLN